MYTPPGCIRIPIPYHPAYRGSRRAYPVWLMVLALLKPPRPKLAATETASASTQKLPRPARTVAAWFALAEASGNYAVDKGMKWPRAHAVQFIASTLNCTKEYARKLLAAGSGELWKDDPAAGVVIRYSEKQIIDWLLFEKKYGRGPISWTARHRFDLDALANLRNYRSEMFLPIIGSLGWGWCKRAYFKKLLNLDAATITDYTRHLEAQGKLIVISNYAPADNTTLKRLPSLAGRDPEEPIGFLSGNEHKVRLANSYYPVGWEENGNAYLWDMGEEHLSDQILPWKKYYLNSPKETKRGLPRRTVQVERIGRGQRGGTFRILHRAKLGTALYPSLTTTSYTGEDIHRIRFFVAPKEEIPIYSRREFCSPTEEAKHEMPSAFREYLNQLPLAEVETAREREFLLPPSERAEWLFVDHEDLVAERERLLAAVYAPSDGFRYPAGYLDRLVTDFEYLATQARNYLTYRMLPHGPTAPPLLR